MASPIIVPSEKTMSVEANQRLDEISKTISELRNVPDSQFDEWHRKISNLLTQVIVQRKLDMTSKLIRDKSPLPVRRINYNIKKLSDGSKECDARWSSLRQFDSPAILFCALSFTGLFSIPSDEFDWLVQHLPSYLEAQNLPSNWVARDQIRKALASTPRRTTTRPFIQQYHELEVDMSSEDDSGQDESGTKRRRTEVERENADHYTLRHKEEKPVAANSLSPSNENREMKYMYTNALATNISKLPEPFRTAVQNSRLWNWERNQGLETSGCWPSLFPKDHTQDVSFTIWCGHDDGYRLNDIFGSQQEVSSYHLNHTLATLT